MAIQIVKSTFSLDVETARALEGLARRWRVSKSEALRRAVRASVAQPSEAGSDAVRALDELQRMLDLDGTAVSRSADAARDERRAASRRRERVTR